MTVASCAYESRNVRHADRSSHADMNRRIRTQSCASLAVLLGALLVMRCDRKPPGDSPATDRVPQRIVTIAPNAAEIIAALGEAHRLVGVSRYCNYPPELANLQRVGGLIDPNFETILRLNPDLLVIRGKNAELERLCQESGIRLHRDPTESFDDIFTAISQLGVILHKQAAAQQLVHGIRARVDKISAAVSGRPRPRVLLSSDRAPGALSRVITFGKGTFIDEIITRAGGENVFGGLEIPYPEVNLESILVAQPDVIIEVMPEVETLTDALRRKIVKQWRDLGSMPAITANRIHILTDANLVIPSPRIADSVARLARLLHPEVAID